MRPLTLLLAASLAACATPNVQGLTSPGAPAAPTTRPAPAAAVTTSLRADPPLPGEDVSAWQGLEEEDAATPPQNKEAHGHDHH